MPRQNTGSDFQRKDDVWIAQISVNGRLIVKCTSSKEVAESIRKQLIAEYSDRAKFITVTSKSSVKSDPTLIVSYRSI